MCRQASYTACNLTCVLRLPRLGFLTLEKPRSSEADLQQQHEDEAPQQHSPHRAVGYLASSTCVHGSQPLNRPPMFCICTEMRLATHTS